MPRDPRARSLAALVDMLVSARRATRYLDGIELSGFTSDIQLQDSVIRRIELIGEAAKRVDPSFQPELDGMTWRSVCGMRDILIHQYDSVDLKLVYDTVRTELPRLIDTLIACLHAHNHDPDTLDDPKPE